MTWLALADIDEFEIEGFGTWFLVRCPEHGSIGKIPMTKPMNLKRVFRAIEEHVNETHKGKMGLS